MPATFLNRTITAVALALTSRFEGFPKVPLEALAQDFAGISVDCNAGTRPVIYDGENDVLVVQGNL